MTRSRFRRYICLLLTVLLLLWPSAQARTKYKKPYYITVDLTNQIVTVYNATDDSIARQMICSTGMQETTPRGTFYLPKPEAGEREPWYYFTVYNCYAQYVTRIIDDVLFHSIPCSYKSQSSVSQKGLAKLGKPASHGCIRLRWQDAQFIAEQCEPGTRVEIYKSRKENEDLRLLLRQESYDGSMTYRAYLGIVEDYQKDTVLGIASKGDRVRDLQCRLRDLGIFNGEITGVYHGDTVNAVRQAQRLMGVDPTGTADEAFLKQLYSEGAPVAFNVVLGDGFSGPAVRKLQQRLSDLRIYEGPIDGIYDAEVVDALKRFQVAYGYEIAGDAAIEVQKSLAYEVERLHDIFDPMGGYSFGLQEEMVEFGRVEAASGIRIRSKPSKSGIVLGHVPDGAVVILLEKSGDWSLIHHGSDEGYVKNEYMRYFTVPNDIMTYTSLDGFASYRIGHTRAEYLAGDISEAERINLDLPDAADTVTVNTGRDDLMLNLRQIPDAGGAVLSMLPNGTQVRPLIRAGDWTLVDYNGVRGYLMDQYILRPTEGDDGQAVSSNSDALLAIVKPLHGDKAQIYDADSDDAEILGSLKGGAYVSVIENTDEGWSHISYQGHEGYMRDEDLVFLAGVKPAV